MECDKRPTKIEVGESYRTDSFSGLLHYTITVYLNFQRLEHCFLIVILIVIVLENLYLGFDYDYAYDYE